MILRFLKKLFYLALVVAIGAALWFVFAIWSGFYSVYSYPPSKENPKGSTLIVNREQREPMFNSPNYKPPKAAPHEKGGGIGFGSSQGGATKPLDKRTILELPYVEWAYQQSLEPQQPSK